MSPGKRLLVSRLMAVAIFMVASMSTAQQDTAAAIKAKAEAGDPHAEYQMCYMYADGIGVKESDADAMKWCRKAADHGVPEAQFLLGMAYENGASGVHQSASEAVAWYRKSAEQGLVESEVKLGTYYLAGLGVSKDAQEAARWYRKAADQGSADAEFNLGLMYSQGNGVPKDWEESARLYRQAAEQGNAAAEGAMGFIYMLGEGVPKDLTLAYMWFNIAADKEEMAKTQRDKIELQLTPAQIADAQRLTREWIAMHRK